MRVYKPDNFKTNHRQKRLILNNMQLPRKNKIDRNVGIETAQLTLFYPITKIVIYHIASKLM